MIDGTILKGIGGFYYVDTESGVYECRARGIFRKDKVTPTVGDYVSIQVLDDINMKGSLDIIKKRKNELIRPRVANVEQAVIVFAAASPELNLDLLDRFVILVEEQSLKVLICINKIDLDSEEKYKYAYNLYTDAGYDVVCLSIKQNAGLCELKKYLEGKISVFAGPSGVGKSSLINAVSPNMNLSTGALSAKIERGKHTTRHAELMEIFKNSYIVDSPGFTSLYLNHIPKEQLQFYFREFEPFLTGCKYNMCSHTHEPDCIVKENVGNGISRVRYDRYVSIYNELSNERKR